MHNFVISGGGPTIYSILCNLHERSAEMTERKMCTIRRIDKLLPVDGADKIECAVIGGWNVIVKKGEFKEGELALYFEIDSWVPHDLAPFLTSEGKEPREYEGVKGERLKSKKIRKVVSQGLLLTLSTIEGFLSNDPAYVSQEGTCLDSVLNVKKWDNDDTPTCDREVNSTARQRTARRSVVTFPSFLRRTDQERIQNLGALFAAYQEAGHRFEATEKLHGTSFTAYRYEGKFGVCSRNQELADDGNLYFETAKKYALDDNLVEGFAVQGEMCGPKICSNLYGFDGIRLFIFSVYDITGGKYLDPGDAHERLAALAGPLVEYVPVLEHRTLAGVTASELLEAADGKSVMGKCDREGVVYKATHGVSFKVVSNKWLLKNDG